MLLSLFVEPPLRYWVWAAAVAELMIAPVFAVRAYEGQPFDSRHIPERYGLFTIIVLGEGVVVVTAALSDVSLDGGSSTAAVLGFGIAAAIWYAYFETVSSSSLSRIDSRHHSCGDTGICSRSPASPRPPSGWSWRSRQARTETVRSRWRPA